MPATDRPEGPDALVETDALTRSFGDATAVQDVTMTIPRGTIVGLIGPSGCGKTTLVRMLAGILLPTSGTVRVFGTDPARFGDAQRRRFGYMPQLPVLFPNLSVWGNLQFAASLYGVPSRGRRDRLERLLELVDLEQHRRTLFVDCSGGMQRRVALAATLVHDPELLFLDEPTAGVDPILRERFWQRFRELRDGGASLIVPTQYVGEAAECDLVAVMTDGRLAALCPPGELATAAFGGVPLGLRLEGYVGRGVLDHLAAVPGVRSVRSIDGGLLVVVDDEERVTPRLTELLTGAGVERVEFERHDPGLDAVFVELVETARRRLAEGTPALATVTS